MNPQRLEIDVAGICSVKHNCTGCSSETPCCCSSYEVTINSQELRNISGCLPLAARFCPHLKSNHSYENVFEEISRGLYCLDTKENGACVFAYLKGNKLVCSLHTVAEQTGILFRNAKPESCLLWPLAIYEGEKRILSIDDDAFEFSCNTRNAKGKFSLCSSIAENIERVFGVEFRNELQEAVDKKRPWLSIPLRGPRGKTKGGRGRRSFI
jgi:hypothetical protein